MYGVKTGDNKLVAIHDELPIVIKFMNEQPNHKFEIIELRKKFMNKLKKTNEYTDLYLVRYNDRYIPYSVYETYKRTTDGYLYDLKYAKDILCRLLEENDMSNKEHKYISKTIEYISNQLHDDTGIIPLNTLKDIKLLDDEYKERISRD